MLWLFWISLALIVYTYVGYPVLLVLLRKVRRPPVACRAITPRVSLIIPIYNQETRIAEKLQNSLALDYPQDKLEIIAVFDGSVDRSFEIASTFGDPRLKLLPREKREGKHYAQGHALEIATGEIIVFTDAAITLPRESLARIVSNFADPEIGCVSSVDRVVSSSGTVNAEGAYIRYDMFLRTAESAIGSSTGMSGSFYAVRKPITDRWLPHLSNDFYMPLKTVMMGYRAILDEQAVGYYAVVASYEEEVTRKVRTIVHGIDVLFHFKGILNPLRYGFYSIQVLSHKLMRWLIPFCMIAAIIANLFLLKHGYLYGLLLGAQEVFYLTALAARLVPSLQQITPIRMIYYFAITNLSIIIAWYIGGRGERYVLWEPSKR